MSIIYLDFISVGKAPLGIRAAAAKSGDTVSRSTVYIEIKVLTNAVSLPLEAKACTK